MEYFIWIILIFGLYLDMIPLLALSNWTDPKHNPPSPTPVVSWVCYLIFSLLVSVPWWEKILLFILLFFAPMFIRGPFIKARRQHLDKQDNMSDGKEGDK